MNLIPLSEQFELFEKYYKEKRDRDGFEPIGLNLSGNNERLQGVELQAEVISEEINVNR